MVKNVVSFRDSLIKFDFVEHINIFQMYSEDLDHYMLPDACPLPDKYVARIQINLSCGDTLGYNYTQEEREIFFDDLKFLEMVFIGKSRLIERISLTAKKTKGKEKGRAVKNKKTNKKK